MMKSLLRGVPLLAILLCAVLFASCGITPLYYPPFDEKSSEAMFDADVRASLLKTGKLQSDDGDVTVEFSVYPGDELALTEASSLKGVSEKSVLRGHVTIVDDDNKEEKPETWLPVLIVPFRHADKLYFYMAIDQTYIVEKFDLNPEYIFMTRPYSYILAAEPKEGGWEIGFVQFATKTLELKKIAENVKTDEDGTVFNPPAEILDMLKDPKNYETSSKMLFKPVKSAK